MSQRIRSHLTFANVVSVTALFVALGGTAIASVIITSNSQVAQNTISGHKPPERQAREHHRRVDQRAGRGE